MRPIKFRAWDGRKMCLGENIHVHSDGVLYTQSPDQIVMQFTGLLDKNGKEIYEGDIVKGVFADMHNLKMTGVVFYDLTSFRFKVVEGENRDGMVNYFDYIESDGSIFGEMEIIGNIWENPELLK